jgi:hypothetical protein
MKIVLYYKCTDESLSEPNELMGFLPGLYPSLSPGRKKTVDRDK